MVKITISYHRFSEVPPLLEAIGRTMDVTVKRGPKTGAKYMKIYLECEPKTLEKTADP